MSLEQAQADSEKLAFGVTFGAAFGSVFSQIWLLFKASILPLALSLAFTALTVLLAFTGSEDLSTSLLSFALQVLGLLPLAILGIAFCRLILIGRQAGVVPRPLLGRRTLVYFGYILLFLAAVSVPVIASAIAMLGSAAFTFGSQDAGQFDQLPGGLGQAVALFLIFYLVFLYFMTRLSLVFPAAAVDQKLGLAGSWRLTRGSGLKLYAVLIVITILVFLGSAIGIFVINSVTALVYGAENLVAMDQGRLDWVSVALFSTPSFLGGLAFQYLGLALLIGALSAAYAKLSGWGGTREDILERFE